jgi:hypothetical protein
LNCYIQSKYIFVENINSTLEMRGKALHGESQQLMSYQEPQEKRKSEIEATST